jgi:hypothetical protein
MPLIPFPKPFTFLEFTGIFLHRLVIKRFNFCFIPDLPGDINVSGRLSHGVRLPENTRFIGILSRFAHSDSPLVKSLTAPLTTVILSGPEPQRSILKNILTELLQNRSTAILEGRPGVTEVSVSGNITTYSHPGTTKMTAR